MNLQAYLEIINKRFKTGISREHTYRGDLQTLLMTLLPDILVTNEPSRVHCGAPDYVLTKKDIPVGYIEAKDIGVDLNSKTLKEQFDRYRSGLSNLIFTDYLEFLFYKNGVFVTRIEIAKIDHGNIIPIPENFEKFESLIKNFALTVSQTIKSPTKLAEMMAGKAKLMADVIEKSLDHDDETETRSALKSQMLSFKQMLIHDINNSAFADIYAQTIAYGMFAARYHDPTLPTFSRQEAAELIPKSNPFLRKLFQDIAGYDLDNRLVWMVDELVAIFLATDVASIMTNFGKSTKQEDPVVHFYETFLATYNPALRKARGVWYTPQPVVNFIVRAVDDILKTEFNLPRGLADTSKVKIKTKAFTKATSDQRSKVKEVEVEREVHKVQILDPATGTGTFLAEVVKHIYKKFEGQQGIWSNYVSQHLIPRLNGFELLMASYAMAHLKMDILLTETGYKPKDDQRFRIFLTNSLEESHPDSGTLFSSWLSDEADQANTIKRDTPVMVIMGNPPYSTESSNRSQWIMNLMEDYKKEPGGKEKLKERNPKAINGDEYKFIKFGQHFIEKNGNGVLAFINPHTFLEASLFRGMRWNLLKTFDKILTIDLHGNSTKKESSHDGSIDVNVFEIMQGVSINIFIKTGRKAADELGKVFHYDLYGKREFKYDFLNINNIASVPYQEIQSVAPNYYFVPKVFSGEENYSKGFELTKLMPFKTSGIKTHDDVNLVSDSVNRLKQNLDGLKKQFDASKVLRYSYRPFDTGFIYYDTKLLGRAREKTIYHLKDENLGLILVAQPQAANINYFDCVYITNCFTDTNMFRRGGPSTFPLYLYKENHSQQTTDQNILKTPNLDMVIVSEMARILGLIFTPEKQADDYPAATGTFAPLNIFDYIYAILHSPNYRDKYREFLKIDFPRIPYPEDTMAFWKLVNLGKQLREIHLLENLLVDKYLTQYLIEGDNVVQKPTFENGRIFINQTQYFENVPERAWNFSIGGYQPAQKWLKDRKGKILDFDDIQHYQKVIVALNRTAEIMIEIDKVIAI